MSAPLRLFTSESVTEGHPDKICDQISDSILDALIAEDPHSRVAVETVVTTGLVHVVGEVTTSGYVDIPTIVRERIIDIGYNSSDVGFDGALLRRLGLDRRPVARHRAGRRHGVRDPRGHQTPTRSTGRAPATRASCSATPPPRRRSSCRCRSGWRTGSPSGSPRCARAGCSTYLRPDGKTQVTIGYDGNVPAHRRDRRAVHAALARRSPPTQLRAEVDRARHPPRPRRRTTRQLATPAS